MHAETHGIVVGLVLVAAMALLGVLLYLGAMRVLAPGTQERELVGGLRQLRARRALRTAQDGGPA